VVILWYSRHALSAIFRNKEIYPNPSRFSPDRFLKDGKLNPEIVDPALIAFGFGRRVCAGRYLAFESVWMAVACVLAVFNILYAKDEHGTPIIPNGEYTGDFVR
jgi:cytochrome P450